MNLVGKTVTLDLTRIDGNAFALLGAFAKQAKREGWSEDERKKVTTAAMSGDYSNLVATLADHCE